MLVTKVGQAHDLAPGKAAKTRLHLTGTITYYDSANNAMFLEDATGGIFVNTNKEYPVHAGDLVQLDGRADSSYRTEVAFNPFIHVLGRGKRLRGHPSSYQDLVAGSEDCKLVTIRGRVRAADVGYHPNAPVGHLDLLVPGGEIEIYVDSPVGFYRFLHTFGAARKEVDSLNHYASD